MRATHTLTTRDLKRLSWFQKQTLSQAEQLLQSGLISRGSYRRLQAALARTFRAAIRVHVQDARRRLSA